MPYDPRVVQVQRAAGPSVEFRSTPRGVALSSHSLGVLLEYARPRSVNRLIVKHLLKDNPALQRNGREWWLVRDDVTQLLQYTRPSQDAACRLDDYFTTASPLLEPTTSGGGTDSDPDPGSTPRVDTVSCAGLLTPREQLQLAQVRIEQARLITALITARRLAKELTPQEHWRLAHKAAETALGELIALAPHSKLAAVSEGSSLLASGGSGSSATSAKRLNAKACVSTGGGTSTPALQTSALVAPDPLSVEPAAPSVTTASSTLPSGMPWLLSRYNPPTRATASELAYLVGCGCTRQKIGIEASRLGFKEGHPWVETKQVQGRHSLREDCTVYYYNQEASVSLIEAVLTYPTKNMLRRLRTRGVPLDLFKAPSAHTDNERTDVAR